LLESQLNTDSFKEKKTEESEDSPLRSAMQIKDPFEDKQKTKKKKQSHHSMFMVPQSVKGIKQI